MLSLVPIYLSIYATRVLMLDYQFVPSICKYKYKKLRGVFVFWVGGRGWGKGENWESKRDIL